METKPILDGCSHVEALQEPHECPYQSDVNNNPSYRCRCCKQCEQDCSDAV